MAVRDRGTETRTRLKDSAQRLIAERGVAAVTVRDIVTASGQRNIGSLHYYFEDKEALLAEITVDAAKRMDTYRRELLDALEGEVDVPDLRDLMGVLIWSLVAPSDGGMRALDMKFLFAMVTGSRETLMKAIYGSADSGWRRVISLIKNAMPPLPSSLRNTRLSCMKTTLLATMSARQAALERSERDGQIAASDRGWLAQSALDSLADALVGMLTQPAADQPSLAIRFAALATR